MNENESPIAIPDAVLLEKISAHFFFVLFASYVYCLLPTCIVCFLCVLFASYVYCWLPTCTVGFLRVLLASYVYCWLPTCIVASYVYCLLPTCIVCFLRVLLASYVYCLWCQILCANKHFFMKIHSDFQAIKKWVKFENISQEKSEKQTLLHLCQQAR